jgi:hypothetical protein
MGDLSELLEFAQEHRVMRQSYLDEFKCRFELDFPLVYDPFLSNAYAEIEFIQGSEQLIAELHEADSSGKLHEYVCYVPNDLAIGGSLVPKVYCLDNMFTGGLSQREIESIVVNHEAVHIAQAREGVWLNSVSVNQENYSEISNDLRSMVFETPAYVYQLQVAKRDLNTLGRIAEWCRSVLTTYAYALSTHEPESDFDETVGRELLRLIRTVC